METTVGVTARLTEVVFNPGMAAVSVDTLSRSGVKPIQSLQNLGKRPDYNKGGKGTRRAPQSLKGELAQRAPQLNYDGVCGMMGTGAFDMWLHDVMRISDDDTKKLSRCNDDSRGPLFTASGWRQRSVAAQGTWSANGASAGDQDLGSSGRMENALKHLHQRHLISMSGRHCAVRG